MEATRGMADYLPAVLIVVALALYLLGERRPLPVPPVPAARAPVSARSPSMPAC